MPRTNTPAYGSPLTPRELQAMKLYKEWKPTDEVAAEMGITVSGLRKLLVCVYRRVDAHSLQEAVKACIEKGYI